MPDYKDTSPKTNCDPYWDAEGMTWVDAGCETPVIIDLAGRGYTLTSAAGGVLFDIRGNGIPVQRAWTTANSDVAFLALDRNGDGRIDSGTELFGNATLLSTGERAEHGFVAIRELDANADDLLDSKDVLWNALLLWIDRDHNGVSTSAELMPVAATELQWISVREPQLVNGRDQWGNVFRYAGRAGFRQGSEAITQRLFFDVLLQTKVGSE